MSQRKTLLIVLLVVLAGICLVPPWFQVADNGTGDNIHVYKFRGFAMWTTHITPLPLAEIDPDMLNSTIEPGYLLLALEIIAALGIAKAIDYRLLHAKNSQ